MWRATDLVECVIFIGLALMLAYTAFVTLRFFRRYFLSRRKSYGSHADLAPGSGQRKKNLLADLSHGVETLQSIVFAAPFLGLAGSCYCILCLFTGGYTWIGLWFGFDMSVALVSTAAGLLVAIAAAVSHNILRICLEKLEDGRTCTLLEPAPRSYGFAQTLPLRRRFSGMPAFALTGVPVLGFLLLFMNAFGGPTSTGLPVHLLKTGVSVRDSESTIISVVDAGPTAPAVLYVNSTETPWNELGNTLRSQLKLRPDWIVYVWGEDTVAWAYVANAIDAVRGLHAEVVLLSGAQSTDRSHRNLPQAKKKASGHKRGD